MLPDVRSKNGNHAWGRKGSAMDPVVGIIIIVVLAAALTWWLVARRRGSQARAGSDPAPAAAEETGKEPGASDGALSHGSLAGPSAKAAGTTGLPGAAGFGSPSASVPPPTPEPEHDAAVAHSAAAGTPSSAGSTQAAAAAEKRASGQDAATGQDQAAKDAAEARAAGDRAEWETHWTDAAGAPAPPPSADAGDPSAPHSAVLADIEAAAAGTPYTSGGEPVATGHLAAEEPYGAGSAAPGPDGSGPDGFTVKGDASAMLYYDESDAGYEDAACDVWFLSPAHAEAAGFREPRRIRR